MTKVDSLRNGVSVPEHLGLILATTKTTNQPTNNKKHHIAGHLPSIPATQGPKTVGLHQPSESEAVTGGGGALL